MHMPEMQKGALERQLKMNCLCAKGFSVRLGRKEQYAEFKKMLDIGKHPAFIGKGMFARYSDNGGALFYEFQSKILAVSLVNPHHGILIALNIHPEHRGHGLGSAIVKFLMPNFVRALESRIEFFKRFGYISVGELKHGQSLNTQVMARGNLFKLAGRLKRLSGISADKNQNK